MKNSFVSLGILFLLLPLGVSAQVVINEIMYDLPDPGGDTGREWIEIYNTSSSAIDLLGYKFVEGGTGHNLVIAQGNSMLLVGGFAIIADKPDKFLAEHAGFSGSLFDSTFSLNNTTGEKLALKNASSTVVSEVSYTPAWGAKGDGNSLQSFADGWSAALPTPGVLNIRALPKPVKTAPVSKPVPEVETNTKKVATSNTSVQKTAVALSEQISTSSVTTEVATSVPRNQNRLIWWLLLGGVIIVASLAYWIGGRADSEEFKIIEDKDSVSAD